MYLIKNGRFINPFQDIDEILDIVVSENSIRYIGKFHIDDSYEFVIDASDLIISPIFVDLALSPKQLDNFLIKNIKSIVHRGEMKMCDFIQYISSSIHSKPLENINENSTANIMIFSEYDMEPLKYIIKNGNILFH